MRRAFVCRKCRARTFLGDEPPGTVPECGAHGPMVRQANVPYMGGSTEPLDPRVPPARDQPVLSGVVNRPGDSSHG